MYRPKHHWGRFLWGFIHTITVIDYEDNVEATHNAIYSLKMLHEHIPCPKCRQTYMQHVNYLSHVDVREPMVLFYWSVDLHNAVNRKLGKRERTYREALLQWCS